MNAVINLIAVVVLGPKKLFSFGTTGVFAFSDDDRSNYIPPFLEALQFA